jgi:hypothetical protein
LNKPKESLRKFQKARKIKGFRVVYKYWKWAKLGYFWANWRELNATNCGYFWRKSALKKGFE